MMDFAGKKIKYIDKETGEIILKDFFVSILPCSGYTFGMATENM